MNRQLYFAYGSNMIRQPMSKRCPEAELMGIAVLDGYRFLINSWGVATIIEDSYSKVYGIVWNISDKDERSLDIYEGVAAGVYVKKHMEIARVTEEDDHHHVSALVYVAADSAPGKSRTGYVDAIIDAAVRKGFPKAYIEEFKEPHAMP
jgi:gamma-glutamylcyclotransferase